MSRDPIDPVGPILLAIPALLLGVDSGLGVPLGIALAAGTAAFPTLLALPHRPIEPTLRFVPALAGLALLAASVPVSPFLEGIAGAAGVLFLVALGRATVGASARRRAWGGAIVPAAGVTVALATSLLFSPPNGAVGVAAALVLGTILVVAFLLGAPEPDDPLRAPA